MKEVDDEYDCDGNEKDIDKEKNKIALVKTKIASEIRNVTDIKDGIQDEPFNIHLIQIIR